MAFNLWLRKSIRRFWTFKCNFLLAIEKYCLGLNCQQSYIAGIYTQESSQQTITFWFNDMSNAEIELFRSCARSKQTPNCQTSTCTLTRSLHIWNRFVLLFLLNFLNSFLLHSLVIPLIILRWFFSVFASKSYARIHSF